MPVLGRAPVTSMEKKEIKFEGMWSCRTFLLNISNQIEAAIDIRLNNKNFLYEVLQSAKKQYKSF